MGAGKIYKMIFGNIETFRQQIILDNIASIIFITYCYFLRVKNIEYLDVTRDVYFYNSKSQNNIPTLIL